MVTQNLQQQLDLEANCYVTERQTKDNLENGKEYAGLIKTPYWNSMLDIRVLRTQERLVRYMSFLPQKVVQCELWTKGLQRLQKMISKYRDASHQLLTQMSEYSIVLNCNLWFKVKEIKTKQGLLHYSISRKKFQVQS